MPISNITVTTNDAATRNVSVSFDTANVGTTGTTVNVGTAVGSYPQIENASAAPGTSIFVATFTAPTDTFHFTCTAFRETTPDQVYTIITPIPVSPDAISAVANPEIIAEEKTSTITATVTGAGQPVEGVEVKFDLKKNDDEGDHDDDDDEKGKVSPISAITAADGTASTVFTPGDDGESEIKVAVSGTDLFAGVKVEVEDD